MNYRAAFWSLVALIISIAAWAAWDTKDFTDIGIGLAWMTAGWFCVYVFSAIQKDPK